MAEKIVKDSQGLAKELVNDCISRTAAIEAIDSVLVEDESCKVWFKLALQNLPSAQPEQRWIPCSERLPEKGEYGKVLVTYIPSGGTLWTTVIIAHYSDLMGIAKPSFHIGNVGKNDFINITEQVTAWMPLPEPYQAERTEE